VMMFFFMGASQVRGVPELKPFARLNIFSWG
jgi:hypothetical protein